MITFWAKLEWEQGSRIREKIRIDVNRDSGAVYKCTDYYYYYYY